MPKKWLWCVAAMVVAAVVWNEYRLYSRRSNDTDREYFHTPVLKHLADSGTSTDFEPKSPKTSGEEESEVTVIDLTWLQRQTVEPPVADTEEPTALPIIPEPRQSLPRTAATPRVADFEPHSADGPAKASELWKKILRSVCNVPLGGEEECEPLPVMPRLMNPPKPCPETSVCPYLNGTGGQQYRR